MKLHLGCGGVSLPGYLNVDVRPESAADEHHDITEQWPWPDGSCAEVLSYHVLEHLTREQGEHYLREAFRVLRAGGRVVLELPDALVAARQFADGDQERANNLWGLQRNAYDFHRWGYTRFSMFLALRVEGFRKFRAGPGTDYHAEQEPCMRIEAVKP